MNILLTKYLFPIKEKIVFSEKMKIYLDNPRTKEEINHIAEYIKISENPKKHNVRSGFFIAPSRDKAGEIGEDMWVANFKDFFNDFYKYTDDEYSKIFIDKEKNNIEKDPIKVIAKMFVVLRYDDEGELEKIKQAKIEMRKKGEKGLIILNKDNPLEINSENALSLTYLLSLLSFEDKDSSIKSFILHKNDFELSSFQYDRKLNISLFYTILYYNWPPKKKDSSCYFIDFQYAKKDLFKWIKIFNDHILKYGEAELEKILYISEKLKNIEDTEEKSQLLDLVSIIELLITHNPDFNRFNIEDSISKQFISKISTIMYLNNKKINLKELNKKLKLIYNLRSNIAHGNFKEINKYIKSLKKDEYFSEINHEVINILRIVLKIYFTDKGFIEYLKEN